MRVEIDKPHVEALVARFPAHARLSARPRFSDRVEADLSNFSCRDRCNRKRRLSRRRTDRHASRRRLAAQGDLRAVEQRFGSPAGE
ncbi:hypothetical protein [Methylocystis sp. SC2]|uniref:hypothetical protein n=1 Tax=Methylocystis sp. (strain SC2) TaxID=187303 RepID=UPI0011D1C5A0|nr:hypothetical protein [Methylocystis sp. SC2]